MKKERFQLSNLGTLRTCRKIGERRMPDGTIETIGRWQEELQPLNLGSINKPQNKDVITFKISVANDEQPNFLDRLFKGEK